MANRRTLSQWGSIQLNRHAPPAHKQAAVGAAPTATTTPVHS
jgi:hypothetical protein